MFFDSLKNHPRIGGFTFLGFLFQFFLLSLSSNEVNAAEASFPGPPVWIDKIRSLSYSSVVRIQIEKELGKILEIPESDFSTTVTSSSDWVANQYRFNVVTQLRDGSKTSKFLKTFDGEKSFLFNEDTGLLVISRTDDRFSPVMMGVDSFFEPFQFLALQHGRNFSVRLADIVSPGLWAEVASASRFLKQVDAFGHKCDVFEIKGGPDQLLKKASYSFEVYFAKSLQSFPIAWRRIDAEGNILEEYEVTEIGSVNTAAGDIFVPSKAKSKMFWDRRLLRIAEFSLSDVLVNQTKSVEFSPNLLNARSIIDADEKIRIPIPRK